MTERTFRIFLGAGLFILLYISALSGRTDLILYYIGLLVFEGITNWRFPKVLTTIRHKMSYNEKDRDNQNLLKETFNFPFEAERATRLVIALMLVTPLIFSMDSLWIVPWFVASMLLLSGVTNICPMLMFFRWMGFK